MQWPLQLTINFSTDHRSCFGYRSLNSHAHTLIICAHATSYKFIRAHDTHSEFMCALSHTHAHKQTNTHTHTHRTYARIHEYISYIHTAIEMDDIVASVRDELAAAQELPSTDTTIARQTQSSSSDRARAPSPTSRWGAIRGSGAGGVRTTIAAAASSTPTSARGGMYRASASADVSLLAGMRGVVNAFNQSDLETRIAQEMDTTIAMQDAAAAAQRAAREIKHQAQVGVVAAV